MATTREPSPGSDAARGDDPSTAASKIAARVISSRAEGEAYVASVCFKHGPPRLTGVELEYLVHHRVDPRRPVDLAALAQALGPHTPRTVDEHSPAEELPHGSTLTVEPGAQIELSTRPCESLAALAAATDADLAYVTERLARAGFALGESGIDAFRRPRRLLRTERYAAMERRFAPMGSDGITMMCSTAALQVCLDVGESVDIARRWAAVHALGPALLALFANSSTHARRNTGHASARWLAVLRTEQARTRAIAATADPAAEWARRVLDTPVMVLRRDGAAWDAPAGLTFADWIDGRGAGCPSQRPTTDDLEYHLSTMFTPVRARGYLELRYLDAQPPDRWLHPVALVRSLLHERSTVDAVLEACTPVAGRWQQAARFGLTDPAIARAARSVADLGCAQLGSSGLDERSLDEISESVQRTSHGIGVK